MTVRRTTPEGSSKALRIVGYLVVLAPTMLMQLVVLLLAFNR